MKLVPFSAQYLKLGEPLPLGLRDERGRLLLGAGQAISSAKVLGELSGQSLFAEEHEAHEWTRRLGAAVDQALRRGASIGAMAAARPEAPTREPAPAPAVPRTLPEAWEELVFQLDGALRDVRAGSDWRARVLGVHGRARQLYQKRPDASLYWMVYDAATSMQKYSCHHALLVLMMAEEAAVALGWPQDWIDSLGRAALTMNVAMMRLQDQLALSQHEPTREMRAEIDAHCEAGARLLQEGGLTDMLCLDVVRGHHDASDAAAPFDQLPPHRQLAQLLRRVDIFTAKISRRATRAPVSPMQAAREACLGPGGTPDVVGGAVLKAVGLYPPGSFVELVSGELGIVIARGRRANLPYVAALVAASGNPLGEPALRDTLDRKHAVKGSVAAASVKVRPPHERLLAMR